MNFKDSGPTYTIAVQSFKQNKGRQASRPSHHSPTPNYFPFPTFPFLHLQGGQFLLNLVDYFGGGFIIFVLATLEVVAVNWIYGLGRFCADIKFMVGQRPNIYWRFCWVIFIPISLIAIFIYSLVKMEPLLYGDVGYPPIAISESRGL